MWQNVEFISIFTIFCYSPTFSWNSQRSCRERYNNPRGRHLAMVRTLALCHNALIHAKWVTRWPLLNCFSKKFLLCQVVTKFFSCMVVRQGLASFSCQIRTLETPRDCSLYIRDGFQPFSQSKVGLGHKSLWVLKTDCLFISMHFVVLSGS